MISYLFRVIYFILKKSLIKTRYIKCFFIFLKLKKSDNYIINENKKLFK